MAGSLGCCPQCILGHHSALCVRADPPGPGVRGSPEGPLHPPHVQTQHPHVSSWARELEARSPPTPSAQSPLLAPGVVGGLPCCKDSVQLHCPQITKPKGSQTKARAAAHVGGLDQFKTQRKQAGERRSGYCERTTPLNPGCPVCLPYQPFLLLVWSQATERRL